MAHRIRPTLLLLASALAALQPIGPVGRPAVSAAEPGPVGRPAPSAGNAGRFATNASNEEPARSAGHPARTARQIQGWEVRVDDRLLASPHESLGRAALQVLEAKLLDITFVMGSEPLTRLQAVPIVLDLEHGRLQAMQYHPSAVWLTRNGYSSDLARCVHICQAADLVTSRTINEQPWVVLHELAHAYHDQVLGFDEPRIRQAWQRFQSGGNGEQALRYDGRRVQHYGLTDQKEFFAEMTEAYFGLNDFFPFNRAELMTAEPEIYELLRAIWGPPRTGPGPPAGP